MSVALDPRRVRATTNTTTRDEVKWYVSSGACHHISGNLDLLNNLSPVSDRWVRGFNHGQPQQALARGSVNYNGIILDDVWYIPGFFNVVSTSQLNAQGLHVDCSSHVWTIMRFDRTVAGLAHLGPMNYFELDFINSTTR